jgi:hypothetical protein
MDIFDLNEQAVIIRESFMGSNLYYIDDFYKNPGDIVDILNTTPSDLHHPAREMIPNTLNGIHFEDRRHVIKCEEIRKVYDHLSIICGQTAIFTNTFVITNPRIYFQRKGRK